MSDERLRGLERRWKETGSVEDEAQLVVERVRQGVRPVEHVEFAAALGCPGARLAVEEVPGALELPEGRMFSALLWTAEEHWAQLAERLGAEVQRRIVIACAHGALPILERYEPRDLRPRRGLHAAERFLIEPTQTNREVCLAASRPLQAGGLRDYPGQAPLGENRARSLVSAWNAVRNAAAFCALEDPSLERNVIERALGNSRFVFGTGRRGYERTMNLIMTEVVPWLLAHSDPVSMRVAART